MKTQSALRWRLAACPVAWLSTLFVVCALPVLAGDPDPRELRERADELERKAQDLKADGQPDRAQQAMREARELRAKARNPGEPESPPRPEKPQLPEKRVRMEERELNERLDAAMAELKELRAAGKEEEAIKVKRRIQELQAAQARAGRPALGEQRPPRDFGPADGPQEMQRRLRHLQAAIENLHAAGMHEPAERLTGEAESMRRHLNAVRQGPRQPGAPGPEIERLHSELEELRQAIRELNRRVDQLAK